MIEALNETKYLITCYYALRYSIKTISLIFIHLYIGFLIKN